MKKFVSMLLALFLLFSLFACSQSAEQSYSRDFLMTFDGHFSAHTPQATHFV